MSGQHHRSRTGWTYEPRPRGTCTGCLESKTVDTHGLVIAHRARRDGRITTDMCPGAHNPPKEAAMTDTAHPTMPPNNPGAQDQCATCSHQRWRHKEVDGQQVCTEYVNCACNGHFVEISPATHMARFVAAAQQTAVTIAAVRQALTDAQRAFHGLYTAMQHAGLLDDEPHLCDGCDRTDHPVTASPDGRALLCPNCQQALDKLTDAVTNTQPPQRTPALQQLDATQFAGALDIPADIPAETLTGPSPDGLPGHWTRAVPYPQRVMPTASCSTCWPRPCDPNRSQCRRRTAQDTFTRTWDQLYGGPPQPEGANPEQPQNTE